MAEPESEAPVVAQVEQPSRPEAPYSAAQERGLDLPLLLGLAVILGLVIASNVWLRRRAEREAKREPEESKPG